MGERSSQPDALTLATFAGVVLLGGTNFVAVRFSNQELPPFYGAGVRFTAAGLIFLGIMAVMRLGIPRGRALVGTVLYGVLGFTGFYALAYWALVQLPAGVGALVAASVPLVTLFLVVLHRLERFRWQGLLGALITIGGIAVLLNSPVSAAIPIGSLLAMVAAVVCASESSVIIKQAPPAHPVSVNAVAMTVGTPPLFLISRLAGESWSVPQRPATWLAVSYLVLLGSVLLFGLYLVVLQRWTATGASYQFVLMPVVAVVLGGVLAAEPMGWGVMTGGLIVLLGVYVGALFGPGKPAVEPVPEPAGVPLEP